MEQAQVVGKECNQTYVQVTYDLVIAKIAYKIQSTSKPQFNNLFIHLGSFHLMMAFFKAIGVFINECGLSHMMIESNIIASGSVNGLVEGKHFNRCKRLHPLMALGLKMLHFDHFLDNIEYNFLKEQVIDDLLHYQEVIDSHSSMPIELPNNVLTRVLSAYQKFIEETRQGKLRSFKLLEKSVEYQLACQEIITDDELECIFATLEKFICHMYGVPNSSNVNDVCFYLFSKTYQSKDLDDNFEKKCRSFDSSSLPPCKAELYEHLLRVQYVTKFWRNAHLKNPSSLSPLASGWIVNDDKYDFVWFAGEQFPSSAADIVIKVKYYL
ncbi:uncharacterized protein TNCV_4187081 [Trichonephila clavipes]|nr:uncharacterized protein TNCV_4187081 [Trichonephila clavipes]